MTFKSFISDVENIPGEISGFFSAHQTLIHTAISDAQSAVSAAIAIMATLASKAINGTGPNPVLVTLGGVSNALTLASSAAASEANATTLNAQATNLAALANALITSGDIGVKSAASQAALTNTISTVVAKAHSVIGALVTAANAAAVGK